MAALVDTNILIYRVDPRDARKYGIARDLLRAALAEATVRVAYQAIVEFYATVSRPIRNLGPLLPADEAARQTADLFKEFDVIYPNESIVRTALRGATSYQLSWYDALMWAYAENSGLTELISEDFQHGRTYGRVRAVNPFV